MRYNIIRMKFKTIEEALNWITAQRRNGSEFAKFKCAMNKLGNPQDKFKMIHVAGTNGKGSTVCFLRDALMALGYKVGTLQSPHYLTHLDRIRVNGINIDGQSFLDILNEYYDFFETNDLNMFEMDYVIMCEYFKREAVDFALVEVGMGGRLDSTNVIKSPIMSIITTIGFDHMHELGDTLEKICYEKCGIIKNNSHVLVGGLNANLKAMVNCLAKYRNSIYHSILDFEDLGSRTFKYRNLEYQLYSYAKYQMHNASLAIEALYLLDSLNYIKFDYDLIKSAIAKSNWQGRFEIVRQEPLVIVDGAHNIDGVKALITSINDIKMPKALLFSAIKTKEYEEMLKMLGSNVDKLVLTTFNHPQVIDAKGLASKYGYTYVASFKEAYEELYKEYPCIIVSGSLYFLSEFIEYINRYEYAK